jgi:hypothetical protein
VTSPDRPVITPALARWMATYVTSLLDIAARVTRVGVQSAASSGAVFSTEFLEQLERVQAAASSVCARVGRPLTAVCPRCGDALGFAAQDRQRETLHGWCSRCAVVFEVTLSGRATGTVLDVQAWERGVTGPRGVGPVAPGTSGREAV